MLCQPLKGCGNGMVDVEADVADMGSIMVNCSICGEMEC